MNLKSTEQAVAHTDATLENYIKISADTIAELRKTDVFRVIDSVRSDNIDGVTRGHLATFIAKKRPDLVNEVTEIMEEEFPGDGWTIEGQGSGGVKLDYHIADNAVKPYIGISLDDEERATIVAWDLPTDETERDNLELLVIGAVQAANTAADTAANAGDECTLFGLLTVCARHCSSRSVEGVMTHEQKLVHDGLIAKAAELSGQPATGGQADGAPTQSQPRRTTWDTAGYGDQYLDGYFRNTGYDTYPDKSLAQDAWSAGYEDWRADVAAGREVTA